MFTHQAERDLLDGQDAAIHEDEEEAADEGEEEGGPWPGTWLRSVGERGEIMALFMMEMLIYYVDDDDKQKTINKRTVNEQKKQKQKETRSGAGCT